jgi:hypothetical protein
MAHQLTLIELAPSWRLDDATREAGRRGVAEARATLQAALAGRQSEDTGGSGAPGERRREHPRHGRSAA